MSRYEFGEVFQRLWQCPRELLIKSVLDDVPAASECPKDCSLVSRKIISAAGLTLTSVEAGRARLRASSADYL